MKWYKIYLNGENRIWKKCITYSWEFIYEDKEINFQRIIDSSSSERYQIKALIKGKGLIAKSISEFGQIRMPEFAEVSHLFLVREDILNINELSSIKGISLKRVSVHGDFPLDYMAIIFNEVIDCDKYDLDENDEKVNNGEFFIWYDGTKYKMSRAVNSLVTTTQGKQEGYQTIKIVDIMDMIYDDIRTTAQDSYIGKYANTYDNKCLLITAITGYLKELEGEGLLQANYSVVELDTEAIKNYQLQNGLYTKDELADMSDDEINQLDTKKKVFLKGKIKIIDAMEDIELPFDI